MKTLALSALVILGVLFPVTFIPAQGNGPNDLGPENEFPAQQADTIVIQLVADADSVIAVPNSVTVNRGQVVTWASELGDWTVFFRSGQPFGDQAVGEGIRGGRGQRNGQAVRNEAETGAYKYDILICVQGGQNLRRDPEVVIAPRRDN